MRNTSNLLTSCSRSWQPNNLYGNYDSLSHEITLNAQVLCSDGRRGIVVSTRESSGLAGHGTVRLNDGSDWTFIFGSAAANF